jgi:hypothetical protein
VARPTRGERKEGRGLGLGETWARGKERAREGERERVWAGLGFFASFLLSYSFSTLKHSNHSI